MAMKVTVKSLRVTHQHNLSPTDYTQAMVQEAEELDEVRLAALDHLYVQKKAVARMYNKRVKHKVWRRRLSMKGCLPIGFKDPKFGKWSTNWEGPYVIFVGKGAYQLHDKCDGLRHSNPKNGHFLKKCRIRKFLCVILDYGGVLWVAGFLKRFYMNVGMESTTHITCVTLLTVDFKAERARQLTFNANVVRLEYKIDVLEWNDWSSQIGANYCGVRQTKLTDLEDYERRRHSNVKDTLY
ncbi:hypothetical protein FNV43_RR12832 [Rhamnella rubrinervis]|uniref:Uncharacterized protein n=1 Tax=Rhamnella rubrinervis TaxID=2594499 RepID=A0A8K0H930_9ROSA|nr:hypothetical protein FNV43_RR12832 [Rhamnella rubrinervis]